jgi:hypothetical protein
MRIQRKKGSLVATLFLAAVLGTSAYAFTSGVTFPGTAAAGDGQDAVSGYIVTSGPHYTIDAVDNTLVGGVTFTLNKAATTVKVDLSDSGSLSGTLKSCAPAGGTSWSCDVSSQAVTIAGVDGIRVVALN